MSDEARCEGRQLLRGRLSALCLLVAIYSACHEAAHSTDATGEALGESRSALSGAVPRARPRPMGPFDTHVVAGLNDMGFGLYRRLADSQARNLVISPASVGFGLAVALGVADGSTAEEIERLLRCKRDSLTSLGDLRATLLDRATDGVRGKDGRGIEIALDSRLWVQKGNDLTASARDALESQLGAALHAVDFAADPERARGTINASIADGTHGKMRDVLARDAVQVTTQAILADVLYYRGTWATPFDAAATHKQTFHGTSGDVKVDMMTRVDVLPFARGQDYQVAALPYTGGNLSFLIVLPSRGKLRPVRERLSAEWLSRTVTEMTQTPTRLALSLPRFRVDFSEPIKLGLQALGVQRAFENDANFAGISRPAGRPPFALDSILHKTFISVAEVGTEAAAVTTAATDGAEAPEERARPFIVDRPFLFIIRDESGAVLFLGELQRP